MRQRREYCDVVAIEYCGVMTIEYCGCMADMPRLQTTVAVAQRECNVANVLLRDRNHFSRSEASAPPTRRAKISQHVKPRFGLRLSNAALPLIGRLPLALRRKHERTAKNTPKRKKMLFVPNLNYSPEHFIKLALITPRQRKLCPPRGGSGRPSPACTRISHVTLRAHYPGAGRTR